MIPSTSLCSLNPAGTESLPTIQPRQLNHTHTTLTNTTPQITAGGFSSKNPTGKVTTLFAEPSIIFGHLIPSPGYPAGFYRENPLLSAISTSEFVPLFPKFRNSFENWHFHRRFGGGSLRAAHTPHPQYHGSAPWLVFLPNILHRWQEMPALSPIPSTARRPLQSPPEYSQSPRHRFSRHFHNSSPEPASTQQRPPTAAESLRGDVRRG